MSTNVVRHLYGLAVWGFGWPSLPDTQEAARLTLYGQQAEFEVDVEGGSHQSLWVGALASPPKIAGSQLKAFDGGVTTSTLECSLIGIDDAMVGGNPATAAAHLAAVYLLGKQPRRDGVLVGSFPLGSDTTAIQRAPGGRVPAAGLVMYVGREAMLILDAEHLGSQVYGVTVDRHRFSTLEQGHSITDSDLEVYLGLDHNPIRLDREAVLYRITPSSPGDPGEETPVWRGVLDKVDYDRDLLQVHVKFRDTMGLIGERVLGMGRWEGPRIEAREGHPWPDAPGAVQIGAGWVGPKAYGAGLGEVFRYRHMLPAHPISQEVFGDGRVRAMGVAAKGTAWLLGVVEIANTTRGIPLGREIQLQRTALSQYPLDASRPEVTREAYQDVVGEPLREICYHTARMASNVSRAPASNWHPVSNPDAWTAHWHPLHLLMAHLTSTGSAQLDGDASSSVEEVGENGPWDWYAKPWGLGIPLDWTDAIRINALAWGDLLELFNSVRAYFLGGDDEKLPKAADVLASLAQAAGCYMYLDARGRIAIGRLSDPGEDYADATLSVADLAWESSIARADPPWEPLWRVAIETCQVGPGGPPARVLDQQDPRLLIVSRAAWRAQGKRLQSTLMYGNAIMGDLHADAQTAIYQALLPHIWASIFQLPQFTLTLSPLAPRLVPGMWVNMYGFSMIPDGEGGRGYDGRRVLVLSSKWDLETGIQVVEVLDWSALTGATHYIAPSWIIGSVDSAGNFDIIRDWFTQNDMQYFAPTVTEGGPTTLLYSLWTYEGEPRSANAVAVNIVDRDGTAVELYALWKDSMDVTVVPNPTDLVRLERTTGKDTPWYASPYRYVYICNFEGEIGLTLTGVQWDV